MDDNALSKMTFRQAMARKWQMPLFLASVIAFGGVLVQLRPKSEPVTFEDRFKQLELLAEHQRYDMFFPEAEIVRQEAEGDNAQAARVHALAAAIRVEQLRQSLQFSIEMGSRRAAEGNYEHIIRDYSVAAQYGAVDIDDPCSAAVFRDLAVAHWCLNDADKALSNLDRAIELGGSFNPQLAQTKVKMLLAARPADYLATALEQLELLLADPTLDVEQRAWAFVRKAEVYITQGREAETLAMLNTADEALLNSSFGGEVEFMRGRALRQAGQLDEADILLRNLLKKSRNRGDTYAQIALELGRINLEQYRDQDARDFYEKVVSTQFGKDWYVAAKMGLGECAALQHRYDEAVALFQETADALIDQPYNRALTTDQLQHTLAVWAQQLSLRKQYQDALNFLDIEQQVAAASDIEAADRFARMHARMAEHLLKQVRESQRQSEATEPGPSEEAWLTQQHKLIGVHFTRAAEEFVRVADLITDNDELYGDSLWNAAQCYDKAGEDEKTVELWSRFVDERQGQPRWPYALFRLGQAYQAVGLYNAAISAYQNLRRKHPKFPAAFDAMIPMARCYLAKEPPEPDQAETILLSVLSDRAIMPDAPQFRQALFELGQLYYSQQKYPQAINRLIEAIDRYPDHPRIGKMMFLVGDSYYRSGQELEKKLAESANDPADSFSRDRYVQLLNSNLEYAREYFSRAINFYESMPAGRRTELDEMYLRHGWLYHADCMYDLGLYEQAASVYEGVVLRYQLTPTALSAFLQIVNCQLKIGNHTEARAANQRALWQLRKMSDDALAMGPVRLGRQQWQQWFEWTQNAGLW